MAVIYCVYVEDELDFEMVKKIEYLMTKVVLKRINNCSYKEGVNSSVIAMLILYFYISYFNITENVAIVKNEYKSKVLNAIEQMEINFEEVAAFDKEIERLHSEQDKYLTLRAGLYEDLKKQIISEEDFKNFREIYEQRYQELQQAIHNQEETIKKLFKSGVTAGINLERMKNVMQITELDRVTLISFVKRILVYEDKRVYLELRYKELFSKVVMLADYVEAGHRLRGEAV